MPKIRVLICIYVVFFVSACDPSDGFKVDYEGPLDIWSTTGFPNPDRVVIVRVGPQKTLTDGYPIGFLERGQKVATFTDRNDIAELVSLLGTKSDQEFEISADTRYMVYHFLFYYDIGKRLMNIRVFQPVGTERASVVIVRPKTVAGNYEFNDNVMPWLEEQIRIDEIERE